MPDSQTLRVQALAINPGAKQAVEAAAGRDHTILYIDEQCLTRDCISHQLASHLSDMSVEPAVSAREVAVGNGAGKRFDLAVLHTHMAGVNDCGVAAQLALLGQIMPDVPVVLLSDSESVDNIVNAFRRGIRGYVPTTLTMKDAAEAIRFVWVGGTFVPPSALTLSARSNLTEAHSSAGQTKVPGKFTPRQREVLGRLWQGKPNKAIAYELNMCESTVKVHIRHIMKKLHARNRTQIVLLTRPPSSHDDNGLSA
jgi:DNA-binding NarL/FixJ family response regulator